MESANPKKLRFQVNTLYLDDEYVVKRTAYKNRLYIYIYKYKFPRLYNVLAIRVMVHE